MAINKEIPRLSASVIVLNYNGEKYLDPCLQSLLNSDLKSFEVIVVDNASTDRSIEVLSPYSGAIRLIRNSRNLLSTRGLNSGIRAALSPIIVLLDLDTEVRPDWLRELIRPIQADPFVGVTGSKLLYSDGARLQHAGGFLQHHGFAHHYGAGEPDHGQWDQLREVPYVTGAAMAIRRSLLDQIGGGLDELFPFYYEDTDLCEQARRFGYRVLFVPSAVAIHHESASIGANSFRYFFNFHRGRIRYLLKNESFRQIFRRGIALELDWMLRNQRKKEDWGSLFLGYAAAVPVFPWIMRRRVSRARLLRHKVVGPLKACIMADALFVRANGDLSCWCDHGKNVILGQLTEGELRSPEFALLELPSLCRIRRAFIDGGLPHRGICENCVMARNLLVTERSECRHFLNQLHLEPSTLCRLRCPDCRQPRRRPPHIMPLSFLDALLSNISRNGIDRVNTIIFEGLGEPLMNSELPKMITRTKEVYPMAETVLTTNGNFEFTPDLRDAPLDTLRVSIDGIDQATYERYRRGGNLQQALRFLEASAKNREQHGFPRNIQWRYILFEWNDSDDEIRGAAQLASEIGVGCAFDLSFAPDVSKRYTPQSLDQNLARLAPAALNISCERAPR
jgi:GT2 family glycosyltransferase